MAKKKAAAAAKPAAPAVLDVDPVEREERSLITTNVGNIAEFFGKLPAFLSGARQLQERAVAVLEDMKALKDALQANGGIPRSAEEDLEIQNRVRRCTEAIKEADDYWAITSVFNKAHKLLVSGRNRTTEKLEEAKSIGNMLHQRWSDEQKRIAREEQERIRLENEQRAREQRERELADLERQAVAAEEASDLLSAREDRFADGVVAHGDPVRAARDAGYRDPDGQVPRLLKSEKIRAAIDAKRTARRLREQAAAKRSAPVEVEHVDVKPNIYRPAGGGGDREYKSAEIVDAEAFVAALLEGKHGIPRDTVMPNQTKLNEYARSMGELIDRWPGIRLKRKTSVV